MYILFTRQYEMVGVFDSREEALRHVDDPVLGDLVLATCNSFEPVKQSH